MRGRRRSSRARGFREPERFEERARADEASGGEQIVVHVHVHRDGRARAEVGPPAGDDRVVRPVLTGKLFDWKGHYDVVAQRHLEADPRPPTIWTAVAAAIRQARALVVAVVAFVLIRRS